MRCGRIVLRLGELSHWNLNFCFQRISSLLRFSLYSHVRAFSYWMWAWLMSEVLLLNGVDGLETILFQVSIWPKQCLFCQIEFFFETLSFLITLNKGEPYSRPSEASLITWVLEPSPVQIASKPKGFRELKTSPFVLRIIGFWFDEAVGKWCTEALGRCFSTHHLRKLCLDALWCLQYYVFFIWPCKWIAWETLVYETMAIDKRALTIGTCSV